MPWLQLIKPLLFSCFLALGATPLVIKFYRQKRWLDDPKTQRHPKVVHRYPVPRGGGIAIYLAIAATALLFLPLDKHLIGILTGGLILAVTGVLDDIYNLNPYWRLGLGFVAAGGGGGAGGGISPISNT